MGGSRNPARINQSNVHTVDASSYTQKSLWWSYWGQGVTTCCLRAEKTTKVVVLRYIESCGNEGDVGSLLASNLAAGTRLAAENESQAHDEKMSRTYELWLMSLEKFAVLFGPNKRPFLAATIQTYMRKFAFNLPLCYLKQFEGLRNFVMLSHSGWRFISLINSWILAWPV